MRGRLGCVQLVEFNQSGSEVVMLVEARVLRRRRDGAVRQEKLE